MATTLKRGRKELVKYGLGGLVVYETTGKNHNIGIIVLPNELGHIGVPHQSGPNALMFIERYGHTLAATTYSDARIALSALYSLGQGMGKIGVVATEIAVASKVLIGIIVLLQILYHELLHREACMVAGYSNCLYFHNLLFFAMIIQQEIPSLACKHYRH